jgi:hypothetical protein
MEAPLEPPRRGLTSMCWFNHLSTPLGRLLVGPVEAVHAVTIPQALRKSAHVGLEGGGAPSSARPRPGPSW